jgi:RNA polymerase sigma-70 factor, ECF subfamily
MPSEEHTLSAYEAPPSPRALGVPAPAAPAVTTTAEGNARIRRMVDAHYDAIWRTVRFLGVPDANAEDAAQQVFCVATRRLDAIPSSGELGFLLGTAWRVASEYRRAARRRPAASEEEVDALAAPFPSPEELLDQKRAHAVLQEVLAAMPADLRIVFVLYEIEELTLPEVASAAGLALGTATSRLRRAREEFQSIVKRRSAAASCMREGGR